MVDFTQSFCTTSPTIPLPYRVIKMKFCTSTLTLFVTSAGVASAVRELRNGNGKKAKSSKSPKSGKGGKGSFPCTLGTSILSAEALASVVPPTITPGETSPAFPELLSQALGGDPACPLLPESACFSFGGHPVGSYACGDDLETVHCCPPCALDLETILTTCAILSEDADDEICGESGSYVQLTPDMFACKCLSFSLVGFLFDLSARTQYSDE